MYDPNIPREQWRAQRRYQRDMRRYYRYQNPLRGLAGAVIIIALIIAFASHLNFLVILFIGLAFASLLGILSKPRRGPVYMGGFQGFIWLLGLALCFAIGFWPWILLPVVVSMIMGALYKPIMGGPAGTGFLGAQQMQPPYQQGYQQPYPPQEQPPASYEPYQQGYQGSQVPPQPTYQEGGQAHQYPQGPVPKQQFDQPQVQYPEQQQELPPMEQK